MVEYGLNYHEARSAIQIQKPTLERDLMKLLSDFDARRIRSRKPKPAEMIGNTWKTERRPKSGIVMRVEGLSEPLRERVSDVAVKDSRKMIHERLLHITKPRLPVFLLVPTIRKWVTRNPRVTTIKN